MHWIGNPIEKTPNGGSIIVEPAGVFSLEIRSVMALCICVRMQYISVHTMRLHLSTALNSSNSNTDPTQSFFCNNTQHTNSCFPPGTLRCQSNVSRSLSSLPKPLYWTVTEGQKSTLVVGSEKKKLYVVRMMKEAELKQTEWKASHSWQQWLANCQFLFLTKNRCGVSCSVAPMNRYIWIFSDKWYSNDRNSAQWPLSGSL